MKKAIYVLIIFIFCFLCIELFCRALNIGNIISDERNTFYRYDKELGWFPIPNKKILFKDDVTSVKYINNSLGFRDEEYDYDKKDKKRIMFIGDSFTFGYGINYEEIFINLLKDRISNFDLLNCGISGYSTDQEYLLLCKYFDIVKPDIVFLVLCVENDIEENMLNMASYGYYKPYFLQDDNKLILNGVPVPKTWLYYKKNFFIKHSNFISMLLKSYILIKNPFVYTKNINTTEYILEQLNSLLIKSNIDFIVGLTRHNIGLENFFKEKEIKFIVLENANIRSEQDFHWNPIGHKCVADKIYEFLKDNKII